MSALLNFFIAVLCILDKALVKELRLVTIKVIIC